MNIMVSISIQFPCSIASLVCKIGEIYSGWVSDSVDEVMQCESDTNEVVEAQECQPPETEVSVTRLLGSAE